MACRGGPRRRIGGGDDIQALRQSRTRLTLATCSGLAYAGVFAYAVTRETAFGPIVIPIGGVGALMLVFVLVRAADDLLGWSLGLGGAAYAVATIAHGTHVDEAAPLAAVGLLLCGELAAWSLDERHPIALRRGVIAHRLGAVAALAVASLAVAALVVAVSVSSLGNGLAWTVFGAAAAVGALALTVGVAARS